MTITREILAAQSPELLGALLDEGKKPAPRKAPRPGHAAGVTAERTRLKDIDDLGLKGCDDLVAAAKYGDKPSDAPTLAVAAIKAGKQAGGRSAGGPPRESAAAAAVRSPPPKNRPRPPR
jgi:hypothetical protein